MAAVILYLLATPSDSYGLTSIDQNQPITLSPEKYGALGNGVTEDGVAFCKMIDFVNSISEPIPVLIVCSGKYVITGGRRLPYPATGAEGKGVVEGIPTITKSNVTMVATGASFIVPPSFPWRRMNRGGDVRDQFAQGISVTGANFKMVGGLLDGNLTKRPVERGPSERNFGGEEFGLCMRGANWQISDVVVKEWGSDGLLAKTSGSVVDSKFERNRRNNVSIVADQDVTKDNPVFFLNSQFSNASQYKPDVYNAPGSGLHIEGRHLAAVTVRGSRFKGNRRNSIRLSTGARDCIVEDCTVDSDIEFRPTGIGQLGGHVLRNVTFEGEAHVAALYGRKANAPIRIENCSFLGRKGKPIVMKNDKGEYNKVNVINIFAPYSTEFKRAGGKK
jgi:hypothetical protein